MTMPPPPVQRPFQRIGRRTADQFAGIGRWFVACLSRQSLVAGIKTFAWLAPLTVLIWVYAEREQVDTIENQTIPIDVVASDRNLYVDLTRPAGKEVTATLKAPRGRLYELRQKIMGTRAAIVLNLPPGLTRGQTNDLDTAQLLSANPDFKNAGVTVSDCTPSRIEVYVDNYVEREIDVQPPKGLTTLSSADFDPPKITVRAPESAINEVGNPLIAYADLGSTGLLTKPGSHEATVSVTSALPSTKATYTPSKVKATFEVRQSDKTCVYPSINVFVQMPESLQARYHVDCRPTLVNVELIGPPDQIDFLLKDTSPRPIAILSLTGEDVTLVTASARPRFEFPEGAKDVRVDPSNLRQQTIDYKFVDRGVAE